MERSAGGMSVVLDLTFRHVRIVKYEANILS